MRASRVSDRQITLIKHGDRWLHLFSGSSIEHVFYSEESIADFSLDADRSGWILWTATTRGCLFRISESEALSSKPESTHANRDIFEDLLNGDELQPFKVDPCSKPVTPLSPMHAAFRDYGPISCICAVADILITASAVKGGHSLSMYTKSSFQKHKGVSEDVTAIRSILIPDSFLPAKPVKVAGHAKLFCVIADNTVGIDCNHSQIIRVPVSLFTSLFGVSASLLDTPMVLFATPGGAVFHLPLNTWTPQSSVGNCQYSVLCHLHSHITNICRVRLTNPKPDPRPSGSVGSQSHELAGQSVALLVCGSSGKCLLLCDGRGKMVAHRAFLEHGPVWACCTEDDQLLYSTGKDVMQTQVCLSEQEERGCLNVNSHSLGLGRIVGMVPVLNFKDGATILLCQSQSGRMYTVSLSTNKDKHFSSSHIFSETMQDLLVGVDNINRTISTLSELHQLHSSIISQLSLAAHLNAIALSNSQSCTSLQCCIKVCKDTKTRGKYSLVFQLTNQTGATLSSDWSLLVVVRKKCNADHHDGCTALSKYLHFGGEFKSGNSHIMEIQVEILKPSDTRLSVSGWLVLDLSRRVSNTHLTHSCLSRFQPLFNDGLAVAFQNVDLDILFFLFGTTEEETLAAADCQPCSATLTALAKLKPSYSTVSAIRKSRAGADSSVLTYRQAVSGNVLKAASHLKDKCPGEVNREATSLLQFLLQDSPVSTSSSISAGCCSALTVGDTGIDFTEEKDDKGPAICVRTKNAAVMTEVVKAIADRFKGLGCKQTIALDPVKFLKEVEDIRRQVDHLQALPGSSLSGPDINVLIPQLYLRMKQLKQQDFS